MDYLISDYHLNHDKIIDYYSPPFNLVKKMNKALVEHWRSIVDLSGEMLYGGGLTIRMSAATLLNWLNELNGEIIFLLGNHDDTVVERLDRVQFGEEFRFKHRGVLFHAINDPADSPSNWKGGLLHGHHHNNWPDQFLFVDPDIRRVNFSVELLDYRPLATDRLVDYLACGERFPDQTAAEYALEAND